LDEALGKANALEISIPFGTGICGHVASTKKAIVLKDAYQVSGAQFRDEVLH
jgi:putative methionine-R-sulfoxide reductase with GAF domain